MGDPGTPQEGKVSRLLEYLGRLAMRRTTLVRDISEYGKENTVWVSAVPREKGCFTQGWGRDEDTDSDVWLEVQNRREPELPSVPHLCQSWIETAALRKKNDLPDLPPEITREVKNPAWQEGADQPEFLHRTERLEDHPEVQRAWDRYVEDRWLPWVEEHNVWKGVHDVYSSLFAIHQEQLRLGEKYELVLGLGLLTWKTPTGQGVRRHLIVADAFLGFEAKQQRFTVRPHPDGAKLRPELNMLDIKDQPLRAGETAKAGLVKNREGNEGNGQEPLEDPWEKSIIQGVLKGLAHSLVSAGPNGERTLGEYYDRLEKNGVPLTAKPIVEYAPALILRERSAKGLVETLKRIGEKIKEGGDIPGEFADLAEIRPSGDMEPENDPGEADIDFGGELFFPKHSNEEQRRIVDKLRTASSVLVQGPPGTGKSHTIANLICHLLATGQRILVTAKTPQALQVLMGRFDKGENENGKEDEGLIPKEVRSLCISLLGSGPEEKRSLESSVGGILRKKEEWNEDQATREREELSQRLHSLRKEKAVVGRRLRDIRESESLPHTIAQGKYQGTAARIAQAMNRDRGDNEWFSDTTPLEQACPISENDFRRALDALRFYTPDKRRELSLACPKDILPPEKFSTVVEYEKKATEKEARLARGADTKMADHFSGVEVAVIQSDIESLSTFHGEYRRLCSSPFPWVQDAVRDIIAGHTSVWRKLSCVTREAIDAIEASVSVAENVSVGLPENMNIRLLFEDVGRLKEHVDQGGKLGWGPFRPRLVKENIHILKTVTLNGRPCASRESIQVLADVLHVCVELANIWNFWKGRSEKTRGPYALQLQALKGLCDVLDSVLSLEALVKAFRDTLRRYPAITEPQWSDESQVEGLLASFRLGLAHSRSQRAVRETKKIEATIERGHVKDHAHPLMSELLLAIRKRDTHGFASTWAKIQELEKQRQDVQRVDKDIERLRDVAPEFVKAMESTCEESYWDARIQNIRSAWHWAQARTWVEEYIRKEDAPSLDERVRKIEKEIHTVIAELASLHAWSFCFSRLNNHHRRHMEAWCKHFNSLTKTGRGKRDFRNRQAAQRSLNECKDAVPAWVMPLHRVWDTVDPSPGMFDVVIVDEASQCGFDALPLFYLGKKVLIVGDEKQISPAGEFEEVDPINALMKEYLYDFEHPGYFDVNTSLFAHGKLRCGDQKIRLLEHFRCMPEIIRFSNDLCYSDQPLIPLRQYGPGRLMPLEHVLVECGYREGTGQRVVNRPEAEELVEKVAELCRDERYDGKTMGVIVLQGKAQARLIESMLLERIGAFEYEHRRLLCGEPPSFQGAERDIVFLSMVAAPDEHGNYREGPTSEQRYNVAASRARDQMWLFHSVRVSDLSDAYLRKRLLQFFENTRPHEIAGIQLDELERKALRDHRTLGSQPPPFDSWFEVDVALELLRRGFNVIPQYKFAGKKIDLVVTGGGSLAVECYGDEWHGADRYEEDMQRQRKLERCRWEFFIVWESVFYANKEKALQRLWELLSDRGITPEPLYSCEPSEDNLEEEGTESIDGGTDESATAPPVPMSPGISGDTEMNGSTEHNAPSDDGYKPNESELSTSQPWSLKDQPYPRPKLWGRDTEGRQSPDLQGESQGKATIRESTETEKVNNDEAESVSYPDPRTGRPWEVETGLKQIVSEHGPLPCLYAYRLYIKQAGFRKVSRRVEEVLSRCMKSTAARGEIELSDEYGNDKLRDKIARLAGAAPVRLRPRGERNIQDIPPSELAEAMRMLETKGDLLGQDEEEVFRKTLDFFHLKRLTKKTREILMVALSIYTNKDMEST